MWRSQSRTLDLGGVDPGLAGRFDLSDPARRSLALDALRNRADGLDSAGERQALLERLYGALGLDFERVRRQRMFTFMSPGEAATLPSQGVDLQLHTHRHRFPGRDPAALADEIESNRASLSRVAAGPFRHLLLSERRVRPGRLPATRIARHRLGHDHNARHERFRNAAPGIAALPRLRDRTPRSASRPRCRASSNWCAGHSAATGVRSSTAVRLPRLKPLAWIAAAGMLVAVSSLAYLGVQVDSSQDLVLLRNAVIAEVAPGGAHEWTPDSVPTDYLAETLPSPEPLERFAMEARNGSTSSDDFETAVSLARALGKNRKRGRGAIQDDTVTALERITADGAGYCADYTQVYGALGRAAGLSVREWGMSFDGYGGDGHAFNEVWDRSRGKWLFIDSFNSFFVTDLQGQPLSATEIRRALLDGTTNELQVVPINPAKFGFKSPARALEYYRRGAPRFFLVWGNNMLTYDAAPAVKAFSGVSRSAEQVVGIALGLQPKLVISRDFADPEAVEELLRLRVVMVAFLLGVVVAGIALILHRRGRS